MFASPEAVVVIREIGDAVAIGNNAPCGVDLRCDTRGFIAVASTDNDPNGNGWAH